MNTTPKPERARDRQEQFLRQMAPGSQFYKIFDVLPHICFFAKDRSGRMMFASRGTLDHNRMTEEWEIVGKADFDIDPAPWAEHYRTDDAMVYRTGEPLLNRIELWYDEVGLPDWYVTNKMPICDRRGRVIGIMGTLEKCTARGVVAEPFVEIRPAVEAIRDQLQHPPTVPHLARLCGLSVRQLQRKFGAIFRMSPRTYAMKMRIRAACDALRGSDEPIVQIAFSLGFCDQSVFTRHFRKHTGTTPLKYRQAMRA